MLDMKVRYYTTTTVSPLANKAGCEGKALSEVPLLLLLPLEVRNNIYCQLLDGQKLRIDVTTSRGTTHRLKSGVPHLFRAAKSLLLTNKAIHTETKEYIFRSVTYFNRNADSQERLPEILGADCTLIRHFELRLNFRIKCWSGTTWPRLLESLVNLPNLESLRLYSTSEEGREPYPQRECGDIDGTVTRQQQEYRSLILLGAFITHRHPNLDLMIEPALDGMSLVDANDCYVHEFRLVKYNKDVPQVYETVVKTPPSDAENVEGEDLEPEVEVLKHQIVNTAAVRELKWQELCHVDHTTLYIEPKPDQTKQDIKSSEQPSPAHQHFANVDRRAFQTSAVFAAHSWDNTGGRGSYNGLITEARRLKTRAEQAAAPARGSGRGPGNRGRGRGRGGSKGHQHGANTNGNNGGRGIDGPWRVRGGNKARGRCNGRARGQSSG